MNETLTQQPPALENTPKKESSKLRGMSFTNRLISTIAFTTTALAGLGEAEAGRREDVVGALVGGVIIGATIVNAQNRQEGEFRNFEQNRLTVHINPQTKMGLQQSGFMFGPNDQYIDNGQGQKLIFKNLGRDDRNAVVTGIGPYQLLIRYTYVEREKVYNQSVFCTINKQQRTFVVTGKTVPELVN